jgi:enamine deaminase RidA (YjgF/YER057c/UK114 family)
VSPHRVAETIQTRGCSVVLRRVEGPDALELFFQCQPPAEAGDAGHQAKAVYGAILDVLDAEGGTFASVVSESLFARSLATNLEPIRAARDRVLSACEGSSPRRATIEIEQPPLNGQACLEVMVHAVLPNDSSVRAESFEARSSCDCAECAISYGRRVHVGEESRFYAGALCGSGEGAYEQTLAMLGVAEDLLQQAGMEFSDVVRTWIHLREMDRDYGDLNRARREFFEERGIDPPPASTGIGGGPVSEQHNVCLGVYAVKSAKPLTRVVMTTPTLNEATAYGADFVRGMRMEEANKVALHVSGTASVDEAGRTAHPGGFDAQADRMLVNVAALLDGQGASFGDVVSAVTYLKHNADAGRLREKFHEAGFDGFPNVLVEARVCRPDLLCETEVLAVLPRSPLPTTAGG